MVKRINHKAKEERENAILERLRVKLEVPEAGEPARDVRELVDALLDAAKWELISPSEQRTATKKEAYRALETYIARIFNKPSALAEILDVKLDPWQADMMDKIANGQCTCHPDFVGVQINCPKHGYSRHSPALLIQDECSIIEESVINRVIADRDENPKSS